MNKARFIFFTFVSFESRMAALVKAFKLVSNSMFGSIIVYDDKKDLFYVYEKGKSMEPFKHEIVLSIPPDWKNKFIWNYEMVLGRPVPRNVENTEEWADKIAMSKKYKNFDEMLTVFIAYNLARNGELGLEHVLE